MLLAIGLLFGSNANVQAEQTRWLLRTASDVTAESIDEGSSNSVPPESIVYIPDATAHSYTCVSKQHGGWRPREAVIEAGEQFAFEWNGGGNDEYLDWPYAYVGDWRMTAPAASCVAGDVSIEWEPFNLSNIPGNPPPNYAARVSISGDDVVYDADLGLIWETESVVWHSQAAPSGNYTIDIKIRTPDLGGF